MMQEHPANGFGTCEQCGLDLSWIVDDPPHVDVECRHDGDLGLKLLPDETSVRVHPGDAIEVRWRFNYPRDGGPPTITRLENSHGHWTVPQRDRSGADSRGTSDGGADSRTIDSFSGEGPESGIVPDSFEKVTGYRAWVIGKDDRLHSTALPHHIWNANGPEVAICQKQRDGHHVSFDLYRLREEAKSIDDPEKRVAIEAQIDREIMIARRSPERNCQCGLYAIYDPTEVASLIGDQPGVVYGRIKAWGKIAEYDKGFRAEMAQIDALFRPRGWLKRRKVRKIAKAYGVSVEKPPVKFLDPDSAFSAEFNVFWLGFIVAGFVGVFVLGGILGYLAATFTYVLAAFVTAIIFGRDIH